MLGELVNSIIHHFQRHDDQVGVDDRGHSIGFRYAFCAFELATSGCRFVLLLPVNRNASFPCERMVRKQPLDDNGAGITTECLCRRNRKLTKYPGHQDAEAPPNIADHILGPAGTVTIQVLCWIEFNSAPQAFPKAVGQSTRK